MKGVNSTSPLEIQDRDEGVARRNRREKGFLKEGSLFCNPGKSLILHKGNRKNVVSRPDLGGWVGHKLAWEVGDCKRLQKRPKIRNGKYWWKSISFQRPQVTSNKEAHKKKHYFLAEFYAIISQELLSLKMFAQLAFAVL